jgi:hypothetical protein
MGASRRIDEMEEAEKNDFLRQLIEGNHLDGAALGITKQVLDKGEESLSPKQKFVFQQDVLNEFVTAECRRDGGTIPWSEMYRAYHNGGYCAYCEYMMNKD